MIRVVHVFAGPLTGGAAKGAFSLHEALRSFGVDSRVLTSGQFAADRTQLRGISWTGLHTIERKVRARLDRAYIDLRHPFRMDTTFSQGLIGAPIVRHPWLKKADIIHLHWINAGFFRLEELRNIQKPIVWTLRDMWPLTGGCHHALDCERYKDACGSCPQLQSLIATDVTRKQSQSKKSIYDRSDITFVGISDWLTEEARKSGPVGSAHIVKTIPNAIATTSFEPKSRQEMRRKHGLPLDVPIILLGANSISSPYKGFELAEKALKGISIKVFIALFGSDSKRIAGKLGFAKGFGTIRSDETLSELYSAADVFLAPSIAESFGKTIAESMCCGTPVVAFNATGPSSIIDHKIDGYLASPYDPNELRSGIEWILSDEAIKSQLGAKAREKVLKEFDYKVIVPRYIDLYEQLLQREK